MITMILYMLLQTSMLVLGQVFLKLGMKHMETWQWNWIFIWNEVILNIWFLVGLILLVGANVFWLWLLNKFPFSQIYPLTSLGFIFGMLFGMFIFHETVSYLQWIGAVMVLFGCFFIAKV